MNAPIPMPKTPLTCVLFFPALIFAVSSSHATDIARETPVGALLPAAAGVAAPRQWKSDAITPVTEKRIAALPAAEQAPWRAYLADSQKRARLVTPAKKEASPAVVSGSTYSKGARLGATAAFYASEEARSAADHIVAWQRPTGGWTKGGDYTRGPGTGEHIELPWGAGTFDNDSTTTELRFLALVISSGGSDARAATWRESFLRGVDYVLAAQYPNGGFPQIYPLAGGYHDAVTLNDDAMVHIIDFLRDVASQQREFAFVPAQEATAARAAADRGIACLLATQLRTPSGRLLIWAQQYDALTLQPCVARNFEPVAACSSESAGVVSFLMSIEKPSPAVVRAVEAAMGWFEATALRDVIWDRAAAKGTGLVERAGAPLLWARYYDLETGKPVFGDRDRSVHFAVTEISDERRNGYSWFNTRPASLEKPFNAWQLRLPR